MMSHNNIIVLSRDKMFSGTWPAFIEMIDGFVGRKETMIFKIVNKEPELGPREKVFLDLLAGSSSSSASRKRPASNQSDSAPPRVANEGEVDVGQDLLDMMQTEVEEACALLKSTAGQTFRPTTCPCCPWRRFDKRAHLIRHLQFQHVTSKRFCPSGTKQLRIAVRHIRSGRTSRESHGTEFSLAVRSHHASGRAASDPDQVCVRRQDRQVRLHRNWPHYHGAAHH